MEGLLTQIIDGMNDGNPLFMGDSAVETKKEEYDEFMETLKAIGVYDDAQLSECRRMCGGMRRNSNHGA